MGTESRELTTVRRVLAAIFVFGWVGTAAELVLLEHTLPGGSA